MRTIEWKLVEEVAKSMHEFTNTNVPWSDLEKDGQSKKRLGVLHSAYLQVRDDLQFWDWYEAEQAKAQKDRSELSKRVAEARHLLESRGFKVSKAVEGK